MPLKLVRRASSPNWYLRGPHPQAKGTSLFESTRTDDRAAAEAFRVRREYELAHGPFPHPQITFVMAAVAYMEAAGERRFLRPLIERLGDTPLSELRQPAVDAVARLVYPGRAPATLVRQVFTPVSAVLRFAEEQNWCVAPRLRRPRQPGGRVRWATVAEAERLVAAAAPHLAPLILFLFLTGARLSEALYLDWRALDLARAHVSFLATKNGRARGVPLHPRLVAALASLPHRVGPVFRRPDGRPYARKADGGGQIKTGFKAACRRAGIADFRVHDCRHTWATWHYAANRDLAALMRLGGWQSERMVLRYAHLDSASLADGVAAIGW